MKLRRIASNSVSDFGSFKSMTRSFDVTVRVTSYGLNMCQSAKEIRKLMLCLRTDHKMSMIWHHAGGVNRQRLTLPRSTQCSLSARSVLAQTLEGLRPFQTKATMPPLD